MKYEEEHADFGDRGCIELRERRNDWMIKGFKTEDHVYLGSISTLYWATNEKMRKLTDFKANCWSSLDHPGGTCQCQDHTWLRG